LKVELEDKKTELAEKVDADAAAPASSNDDEDDAIEKMSADDLPAVDPALYARFQRRLGRERTKRKDAQVFLAQAEEQRAEIANALSQARKELKAAKLDVESAAKVDADDLNLTREKLEQLETRETELAELVETQKLEASELQKQLAESEANLTTAQELADASQAKLADLEKTHAAENQAKISELETEIQSANEKLAESLKTAEGLKVEIQTLSEANHALSESKESLKSELETTKNSGELATALSSLKSMEEAKTNLAKSVESLELQVQENKDSVAVVEELRTKIAAMKNTLETNEQRLSKMDAVEATLESAQKDRDSLAKEIEEKTAEFEANRRELEKRVDENKKAPSETQSAEINRLESELTQQIAQSEELNQFLQAAEKKHEEVAAKLVAVEQSRESEVKRLSELEDELAKVSSEKKTASETVNQTSSTPIVQTQMFDGGKTEVENQLRDELKAQEKRILELESEHHDALEKVQELTRLQSQTAKVAESRETPTKKASKKASSKKKKFAGEGDDLTRISGIGPVIHKKLNEICVTTFAEIAAWTDAQSSEFDEKLAFKDRVAREDWISQAKDLARESQE
jgi:large subunit ribosomal protein L21